MSNRAIRLLFGIVLIGVLLYLVNRFIPMDGTIAELLQIVGIIAVVAMVIVFLLDLLGINLGDRLNGP